jgi:hypothetical protein
MRVATLVQMIEDHAEQISQRVLRRIYQEPELVELKKLPTAELSDRAQDVLKNLGQYLTTNRRDELARRYERLGEQRFEQSIPLREVVRALQIIKDSMIGFVRDQGIPQSSVEIYAEEELEHHIGRFFDDLICHVICGYERALRAASRPSR